MQDDWSPGRLLVDYGARYDIHVAPDETSSQLSPRLNITYDAGRDKFHAYYDGCFSRCRRRMSFAFKTCKTGASSLFFLSATTSTK